MTSDTDNPSSNVYDFPAREYGPQGRWPSPDPAGTVAFHLDDPQTLNRYAYARNNPLAVVDPTGLDCVYIGADGAPFSIGGDCLSDDDSGICVDGKVDSGAAINVDANSNTIQFAYTPYGGTEVEYQGEAPNAASFSAADFVSIAGVGYPSGDLGGSSTGNPDYYTLYGSLGPWSPSVTYVPSSHKFYATAYGWGPSTAPAAIALTAGWLNQNVNVDGFVQGLGGSGCAFFVVGAAKPFPSTHRRSLLTVRRNSVLALRI
jgi:RHS repeat-associated protein